jgi:hypothetical protein
MDYKNVLYISNWADPRVIDIRNDAMLPLLDGEIFYHHRLQLLIVVEQQMPSSISRYLPFD